MIAHRSRPDLQVSSLSPTSKNLCLYCSMRAMAPSLPEYNGAAADGSYTWLGDPATCSWTNTAGNLAPDLSRVASTTRLAHGPWQIWYFQILLLLLTSCWEIVDHIAFNSLHRSQAVPSIQTTCQSPPSTQIITSVVYERRSCLRCKLHVWLWVDMCLWGKEYLFVRIKVDSYPIVAKAFCRHALHLRCTQS